MRKPIDDDGAIQLIKAIVDRAERDYNASTKRIKRLQEKTDRKSLDKLRLAKRMKADCERFFRSDYFQALTGVDGRLMLDRLEQGKPAKRRYNRREGRVRA